MKKLNYAIVSAFLMGGLLFSSCYKDKGNYDLRPIDEIVITGPNYAQDNYSVQQYDELKISPNFTFSGEETSLEFTWKLVPPGVRTGDPSIVVISKEKELNYQIKVPAGLYAVHLEIKDLKTDVLRTKAFGVTVRVKGTQGFLVLNNKANGEQDIDVIVDNTKPDVIQGIYSTNNTLKLKDAMDLTMIQSFTNFPGLLYIITKTNGYTLSANYNMVREAKAWFESDPGVIAPTVIYQEVFGANAYMINNGSLHNTYSNAPPLVFTYRASGDYKATKTAFMGAYAFIYDDLNHRFLRFNKSAGRMMSIIKNPAEDKFDVENIGNKTCLLFDHNGQPNLTVGATNYNVVKPIAYCKDNVTGEVFVYKIGFFKSFATYCESVRTVTAPGFGTATAYVNASNNNLTYYASGNKIYVYDFNTDVARVVYTAEDANVSIDKLSTIGNRLYAVLNSKTANTGSIYFFNVEATGNFANGVPFSKYDGFGKIIDVEYKSNSPITGPNWK